MRRLQIVFSSLAVILLISSAVFAQGGFVHHSTIIGGWSWCSDMELVDDYLYVATAYTGFNIMSLFDPTTPETVNNLLTDDAIHASLYEDGYIYTFGASFSQFEITSPGQLQQVGVSIPFPIEDDYHPYFTDGAKYGDYFYLLPEGSSGVPPLQVVYSPHPDTAMYLDPVDLVGNSILVHEDYAYVLNRRGGMYILDLTNPAIPNQVGHLECPEDSDVYFAEITIADNFAYVAGDDGFFVIDISDPPNPEIIHTEVVAEEIMTSIMIYESILFIGGEKLYQYDITDPAAPSYISMLETNGHAYRLISLGSTVYLLGSSTGVQAINNYNSSSPEILYSQNTVGEAWQFHHHEDYMFVDGPLQESNAGSNFKIYSIADVDEPQLVSYMPMGEGSVGSVIWSMEAQDDIAYITGQMNEGTRLYTVDISDPVSPSVLGSWSNYRWLEGGIILTDTLAYVNSDVNGVWTVDITDPENPQGLDHDPSAPEYSFDFEYYNGYIFVGGYNCIRVLSAHDPSNIFEATTIPLNNHVDATFLERHDNILFAASLENGLSVIDIANPENAEILVTYPDIQVRGMSASEERLYVITTEYDLQAHDFSTPSDLVLLASEPVHFIKHYHYGMESEGDMVYFTDRFFVYLYEFDETDVRDDDCRELPNRFTVANPYPNPFNSTVTVPFTLAHAGQVRFTVYDMLGRSMYEHGEYYGGGNALHSIPLHASLHPIASGMYFLRVDFEGSSQTRKVLFMK